MRNIGVLLLAAVACSSAPRLPRKPNGAPVLEVRGALKGGPYALGRADLDRIPRRSVRGEDPHSERSAVWEGASVAVLVSDRVSARKGSDTVIVRTADRAAIPVPLTVIRQLKPVLADRIDGTRLTNPVLAWPTEQQMGLATDPRSASWWAHDVIAFEIVEWQKTFGPALAPPVGSADAARRGAGLYAESCISCHRMRGVGGESGPELTTVARRIPQAAFAALLPNHPGWEQRRGLENDPDAASEIWVFLRTVASAAATGENPVAEQAGDEPQGLAADRGPSVLEAR